MGNLRGHNGKVGSEGGGGQVRDDLGWHHGVVGSWNGGPWWGEGGRGEGAACMGKHPRRVGGCGQRSGGAGLGWGWLA